MITNNVLTWAAPCNILTTAKSLGLARAQAGDRRAKSDDATMPAPNNLLPPRCSDPLPPARLEAA